MFVQSASSVLHDRHHQSYYQLHETGILSDSSKNEREQFPSGVCGCGDSLSRCTFRQLGQIMVPSAYQSMIDTVALHLFTLSGCNQTSSDSSKRYKDHHVATATTTTTYSTCLQPPSNVNNVRKQMLFVRDLLDIFSPIYSNTSKTTARKSNRRHETVIMDVDGSVDPWATVRTELDVGYTLIGQYQDLDHSHVRYTIEDKSLLQYKILQWYNQFTKNYITKDVTASAGDSTLQYLSLMNDTITTSTTPTWFIHAAESRLFWKGFLGVDHDKHKSSQLHHLQHEPQQLSSIDSSVVAVVQKLFTKQLQLAKKYYVKAYQHASVVENDFEQMDYQ